jgi:DNA end-binding protein Ku
MVELAGHILDSKAAHFDPSEFKDEYERALKALVKRKAAGKPIKTGQGEERPSNVIKLMDALKQSQKTKGGSRRTAAKLHERRSPQRRGPRRSRRSTARRVHRIPASRVVTIAIRPSSSRRDDGTKS